MHSIHFKADQKLLDFVQEKLDKLEHFSQRIINAEVFLRLDKDKEKENKIAEIKLNVNAIIHLYQHAYIFNKNKYKCIILYEYKCVERSCRQYACRCMYIY